MPIPDSSPAQFVPIPPDRSPGSNPSQTLDRVPSSDAPGLAHVWVRARDTVPTRVLEVAEDDTAWRRAGSPWQAETPREPSPSITRQLLLDAYEAYCTNPLAYAVIEQGTNFVLGGGVRATAADARVQRAIDRFWHDRRTAWTCGSTRSRPNSRCLANSSCAPSRTRPPDAW
ncbi:MAG: hypothetical protein EB145_04375 [Proteobacteria bacterium]|nr:hypothetical protein [Pseudomonadota bacterium]